MTIGRRQFIGYVICLLAFVFIAWSFFPGLMTADSIAALSQGRANVYGDLNAPLMSWIWGRLDSIVAGPALIFLIHLAIFWSAAALLWSAAQARSLWLGIALVVFGLLPHVLAQTVVVWKDVALGVSLLMAVALLYVAKTSGSKLAIILSALFLFYAGMARLNAFPAVVPIAVWTGFVAVEIFEIERKRLVAPVLGVGYLILLSTAVYFANAALTTGRTDHPLEQIYLYDLAAISVARGHSAFPLSVEGGKDFSFETIRDRYNERSVSDLIFPNIPKPGDVPPLTLTGNAERVAELRDAWLNAVRENPGAYLRHRWNVFAQLIGIRRSVTAPYVAEGFRSNPPEFRGSENAGFDILMSYFGAFRRPFPQTFFFRAIVWMAICAVLGIMALRRRLRSDWDLIFVLSVSSLLFIAAYFPTTPSTEFRYLFWPAIASAVATIFGVYLLRSERVEQAEIAKGKNEKEGKDIHN